MLKIIKALFSQRQPSPVAKISVTSAPVEAPKPGPTWMTINEIADASGLHPSTAYSVVMGKSTYAGLGWARKLPEQRDGSPGRTTYLYEVPSDGIETLRSLGVKPQPGRKVSKKQIPLPLVQEGEIQPPTDESRPLPIPASSQVTPSSPFDHLPLVATTQEEIDLVCDAIVRLRSRSKEITSFSYELLHRLPEGIRERENVRLWEDAKDLARRRRFAKLRAVQKAA